MYSVLICDDEPDIVSALKIYLTSPDMKIFTAGNGREALDILEREEIHLILMDIMMPVMDGISAMLKIREKSNIPVILLTAKSEDSDKILGLNIGADDYVTKPFNPAEVIARVRSCLRRYLQLGGNVRRDDETLKNGGIELDDREKSVMVDGEKVNLTPTEFDILRLFMKNPGKVFAPRDIYREVWHDSPLGSENTVAVHIRPLREKIEINPAEPRYITVVRGQGYRLNP